METKCYTYDQIRSVMKKKGYKFFEDGAYNVNIIGIRCESAGSKVENTFNDKLYVIYKSNKNDKNYQVKCYPITTDPGIKSLKEFTNPKGCAILVPGQYLSTWKLGFHKNKYEALVQVKPVKVYRDNNRDEVFDFKSIDQGVFGINIHKAGIDSVYVDNWSAGCQVFKRTADYDEFMIIARRSAELYGNSFTYTLLIKDDFK